MKTFILTVYFIVCTLIVVPLTNADTATVHLKVAEDANTALSLSLEAEAINQPLIGISTTLHLPRNVTYTNYTPGQFFESAQQQVTYIISPKKNDPHTLVVGIASLGKTSNAKTGTIVTLHFQKTESNVSLSDFTLEKSVASGVENNQRINYTNILWSIDQTLTPVGPSLLLAISLTLLLVSPIAVRNLYALKGAEALNLKSKI